MRLRSHKLGIHLKKTFPTRSSVQKSAITLPASVFSTFSSTQCDQKSNFFDFKLGQTVSKTDVLKVSMVVSNLKSSQGDRLAIFVSPPYFIRSLQQIVSSKGLPLFW